MLTVTETFNYGYSPCAARLTNWLNGSKEFLHQDGLNESETRSKVIDPLFKNVLGWSESNISREDHINEIGYYDYIFKSNKSEFVLEAKKEYTIFEMPRTKKIKYNSLQRKNPALKEAIEQGIDYAVAKSIDTVVVSNGLQLAITYIPYINRSCSDTYLFRDHDDVYEEFTKFWNFFSPISNIDRELQKQLDKESDSVIRARPAFNRKISDQQFDVAAILPNSPLLNYLSYLHDEYFSDIINRWDLLKKCYVDLDSMASYDKNIESVLKDRAPRMGRILEDVIEETNDSSVVKIEEQTITDLRTNKKNADVFQKRFVEYKDKTKMFVLVGNAGAGKTTFIYRFFNFLLSEADRNSTIWLYLDCKGCAEDTNLEEFIYDKIFEELEQKYQDTGIFNSADVLFQIFKDDFNRIKSVLNLCPNEEEKNKRKQDTVLKIINEQRDHYVKRIFQYLQTNGYATCVIYDNVDQLSTALQMKLFQHANVLRERLRTTIILSLREEVYYQHEHDKSFNFAECDIFHIPAPRLPNVLGKRLKLAREETSDTETIFAYNSKNTYVEIRKIDIINVLSQTFMDYQENTLMIQMLANKDIRESLKLFKKVVTSPNVDTDHLLIAAGQSAVQAKQINKRIPYNELLRGLALGNRVHYLSSSSSVLNVFEVNNDGFFSHFTKLRILLYAQSSLALAIPDTPKGYFQVEQMYKELFRNTVINLDIFTNICKELQKEGLLINLKGSISDLSRNDFITLGSSGYYYLNVLKTSPEYLALVAVDTSLHDTPRGDRLSELYRKYRSAESKRTKKLRILDIAEEFADYLIESEAQEIEFLRETNVEVDSAYYRVTEGIKEKILKEKQNSESK